MKLIQIKDYLLLIDEEAEIKDGGYVTGDGIHYLSGVVNKVTQIHNGGIIVNNFTKMSMKGNLKIIAYYPLTKEAKELDLPELPPFEEDDIVNEVERVFSKDDINHELYNEKEICNAYKAGIYDGYKAAQSKRLENLINYFNEIWKKFGNL